MFSDLSIVLKVYLISFLWQLISWPAVSWYFKDLLDRGWAICRIISTLVIAIIIWQLGNFSFQVNTNTGVFSLSIILVLLSVITFFKRGLLKKHELMSVAKYIALDEYLFLIGLVLMAITRGFAPDIHNLEKFMDFGFVNSYLLSPRLPAPDMWFAGRSLNYYTFGHFWASILIRFLGVTPAVGYNLVLAIIAGLSLSIVFSLVVNIIPKKEVAKITGGLFAAMVVSIGGNSHAFWYFLSHKFSMNGYWYADATRFIYNTIHEFPSYSFVVSDLHGHLLDLPVVLLFLFIFYYWTTHKNTLLEVLLGGLLGIMMMTNTWDLPIYGMLLGFYCLFELISKKTTILSLLKSAAIIILSLVTVAIPWWINFVPISSGIGIVQMRSPLWQIFVLWTSGFIALIMAIISSKNNNNKLLVLALAITSVVLIVIPEFIYAKDIYPNHPRANTMFKLTYQAFILMGISLGVGLGQIMEFKRSIIKFLGIFIILIIFVGSMIFPLTAFPSFYGDFNKYKGLDGEKWLTAEIPERYGVINYLRKNYSGKNMIEAVGDSYTNFNSISVFSGVPTVIGWRVHEWLWRGGYAIVGARDEEVKSFYEDGDLRKTEALIKRYNLGWIVVGSDEKEKYKINEVKLNKFGEVVYKNGNTYLIEIK